MRNSFANGFAASSDSMLAQGSSQKKALAISNRQATVLTVVLHRYHVAV